METEIQEPVGEPTAPAAPAPATAAETISKEEHQRELDRYRNETGQLKKRLKELEDASKTEAERLAEKAALADKLAPEVDELRNALTAEVEARKKSLPKEMLDLLPEGSPTAQLAWIRKAQDAAEKLKPATTGLAPNGSRSPANAAEDASKKLQIDDAQDRFPTLRGRVFRR